MSTTATPPARRAPLRRVGALLGVWAVAAGGALGVAHALDSPVGAGGRDVAQPAAPGVLAEPPGAEAGQPAGAGDVTLPPLALVLDRPPPAAIAAMAPEGQARELRRLAAGGRPEHGLELGSVLQTLGDGPGAAAAFRAVLDARPGDLAARTGLAMVEGATGAAGLESAARTLERLASQNPASQLVRFNLGWVAFHRRDAEGARASLQTTVALGGGTRLGLTARGLLAALDQGALAAAP